MIKINLNDVKNVLSEYAITSSEINAFSKVVRGQIMSEVYKNLVSAAKTNLTKTKKQYIEGIRVNSNSIYLEGFLPNAVESGLGAFDMKNGFQKSSKAKRGKNGGWYLTVPFRIGTPNSSGIQVANVMPSDVYRAIKMKKVFNSNKHTPGMRGAVSNTSTGKVWEEYAHKYSFFEGIVQTNRNVSTNRSTYNTFRRVSSNSDANSWIHSGIKAHNLFDEAWRNTDIEGIIDKSLDAFV